MYSIYHLFSHLLCIIKDCIITDSVTSCWHFDVLWFNVMCPLFCFIGCLIGCQREREREKNRHTCIISVQRGFCLSKQTLTVMGNSGQDAGVHFLLIIPEFKQTGLFACHCFCCYCLVTVVMIKQINHKTGVLSDNFEAVDKCIVQL